MQYLSQDCVGYEIFNASVLQYENDFRVTYLIISIDISYFILYTFKIIKL